MTTMERIGIQGDRGSFNEEALAAFAARGDVPHAHAVTYCHTTAGVLRALTDGTIDRGVFAIYNSRSLMVEEMLHELGRWSFRALGTITIPVRHMLMVRPGVAAADVTQIAAHAEALAQCAQTLQRDYGALEQRAGIGDLADGAAIAAALAAGDARVAPTTAVLGSRAIAAAYRLDIIAEDLQDDPHNTTTFLLVTRRTL